MNLLPVATPSAQTPQRASSGQTATRAEASGRASRADASGRASRADAPGRAPRVWRASDLRGLAQLGFDAAQGITGLAGAVHGTIARGTWPWGAEPAARASGLAGWVYQAVRSGTGLVGRGVDLALAGLSTLDPAERADSSDAREAAIAVLNGVWGDRLAATGNPLAISMSLRSAGRALTLTPGALAAALPQATGRVLVQVHGLCMNDRQWLRHGHDHGQALAQAGGFTPVALHYNSGRHVAENGADFADLLEALLAHWPVEVSELVLLGHSMGGLVARSACRVADERGLAWRHHLRALVCLGTPHHGALLERGGHGLDLLLALSPYAAPFARLGQARSAGITDLRFGNVCADDLPPAGRHGQRRDTRRPTPLPAGVASCLVAATTAPAARGLKHAVLGDGLVTVASAFGEHRDPTLALGVPPGRRLLVTGANHWDLLDRPEVAAALVRWLA